MSPRTRLDNLRKRLAEIPPAPTEADGDLSRLTVPQLSWLEQLYVRSGDPATWAADERAAHEVLMAIARDPTRAEPAYPESLHGPDHIRWLCLNRKKSA